MSYAFNSHSQRIHSYITPIALLIHTINYTIFSSACQLLYMYGVLQSASSMCCLLMHAHMTTIMHTFPNTSMPCKMPFMLKLAWNEKITYIISYWKQDHMLACILSKKYLSRMSGLQPLPPDLERVTVAFSKKIIRDRIAVNKVSMYAHVVMWLRRIVKLFYVYIIPPLSPSIPPSYHPPSCLSLLTGCRYYPLQCLTQKWVVGGDESGDLSCHLLVVALSLPGCNV